jgi:hypothetical protein
LEPWIGAIYRDNGGHRALPAFEVRSSRLGLTVTRVYRH